MGIETRDGTNPGSVTIGMLASLHLDGIVELTDHGLRADGTFRVAEGGNFIEALRLAIPRGSVLRVEGGTMSLGPRDQVSIYEGVIDPSGVLRGGQLTFQGTWGGPFEGESTDDATSTLSPSLGLASIALPMSAEAFVYVGRTRGTRVEILTQIHDPAFWRATTRALFAPPTSLEVIPVRGEACASSSECAAGFFCVDDVCCTTSCGGGLATDCLTCNFGATPETGTCGPAGPEHLCRLSRGYCDIPEACDGSASACPVDRLVPAGIPCRPVRDVCDVAERCDGTSLDCPDDAVAGPERTCRAAEDACDLPEQCSGTLSCPPDLRGCIDAGPDAPSDTGPTSPLDAGALLDAAIPLDALAPRDAFVRADIGPRDAARSADGALPDALGVDAIGADASTPPPPSAQCGCAVQSPAPTHAYLLCVLSLLLLMRARASSRGARAASHGHAPAHGSPETRGGASPAPRR